jgi:hypothetical protein
VLAHCRINARIMFDSKLLGRGVRLFLQMQEGLLWKKDITSTWISLRTHSGSVAVCTARAIGDPGPIRFPGVKYSSHMAPRYDDAD